jgi:membrane associated rhomboid family serine protease
MSVLQLLEKRQLPILSLLLSIALVACFVFIEKQDSSTLKLALAQYKQQNLLKLEKNIYIDFVERRFNIERIGSETYLDKLHLVAQDKNPNHFIALLLKDRFFYPYLFAEGRLFMDAAQFNEWKRQRLELINPIVNQLYELKFALNSEYSGISNLLSYLFVETSRLWLMLNVLILFVCGGFLEYRLGRGKLLLFFFSSAFMCGILYLIISGKWSASMQGLSGTLCALMGACLAQTLFSCRDGFKLKQCLVIAFTFVSIIAAYLSVLWFWKEIDHRSGSVFALMLILGACFYTVLWRLELIMGLVKAEPSLKSHQQVERGFRTELALVMDAISIFNFDKARDLLKLMSEHYPGSPEVMEQRYHIEKLYPNEAFYWACARDLVNYAVANNDYARMKFIFEDTQKNASSKQQAKVSLEAEYYHKMMAVFVAHNDLNKAEKAFLFLELAGESSIIKDACQLLIHEFKTRGIKVKQQQYQMLLERITV